MRPPALFFSKARPWSKEPRTSWESAPAALPSCMLNVAFANCFISFFGSRMLSGIGIGMGPANMPVISPPNWSPRRSGLNSVAVSSHRFASLIARRIVSPSPAVTTCSLSSPLTYCPAIVFAMFTSMAAFSSAVGDCAVLWAASVGAPALALWKPAGLVPAALPGSPIPNMEPIGVLPPMNICIICFICSGLGRDEESWLISCSRSASGSIDSCWNACSPCTGPKHSISH